jgi:hypothetical protein
MRCAMMNRRTEFHAACRFPDERVKTYMANCERAVCLQPRDTVEEMHVGVCEDNTIQRGLISAGMRRCVRRRCVCTHLIIIVSSISSTPWRNRFAKTGGTERTIDAFTEQNSSFSFPLRDLLEPSTSTGGEPFRFMSGADEPVPSSGGAVGVLGTGSVRNSGACRDVYAVEFGAHSIPSPSSTLLYSTGHIRVRHSNGMSRISYLWRTNI